MHWKKTTIRIRTLAKWFERKGEDMTILLQTKLQTNEYQNNNNHNNGTSHCTRNFREKFNHGRAQNKVPDSGQPDIVVLLPLQLLTLLRLLDIKPNM